MDDLIPRFEQISEHKVRGDFDGAIGAMTKRVEAGEPADVVIVSQAQVSLLEKAGKVLKGTERTLAKLGVGMFTRRGAPRPDVATVQSFTRTMLAVRSIGYNDPAAGAPVGIHLLALFERLGIADEMAKKTVVFRRRSDRFAPVARGEVELGFNQISEILAVPDVELIGPLPAEIQNYTIFSAAVVAGSKNRAAAEAFVSYISSPSAVQLMKTRGFE